MSQAKRTEKNEIAFEVLPAVNVRIVVFWDITVCSLVNRYHY